MGLYDRLFEEGPTRIPTHGFYATMAEVARWKITTQQASTIIAAISGGPLVGDEATQAVALVATITSKPTVLEKVARALEINDVLLLAEHRVPGYDSAAAVAQKLGF